MQNIFINVYIDKRISNFNLQQILQDTPGFIVNRLLVPYMLEAVRMVERGTQWGYFFIIDILQSLLYPVKEYISSKCTSCSRHILLVFDYFKKYKFFGYIVKDVMVSMRHYHKLSYFSVLCTSLGKLTCAED